ncbi:MAG: hypothetical protein QXX87_00010 [Candidatus Jordarchaeales archaeon]
MALGKWARLAGRILKTQLAVGYLVYFIVIGAVTVNTFFLSNWWARFVPPEFYPVPLKVQVLVGVALILTLLFLQSLFIVSLYLSKKEREECKEESELTG